MLAVEHLSIQFGGRYLFRDVTFTIGPGERVGIVGPNGAGKSTLFRIIAGVQQPDDGSINLPKSFSIGYLPQEPNLNYDAGRNLLEEACAVRKDLLSYKERMDILQEKMSSDEDHHSDEYFATIEEFTDLQHKYETAGGFTIEAQSARILDGLGFSAADMSRDVNEFSGGWQMRLELAKLLILNPDVLLLDEPTNHLDLESLFWLEDFIKAYSGALLIISHDRSFLNAITTRTIEVTFDGRLESFAGNYDYYETTKAMREAQREALAASLDKRRKEISSFVDRFRYKASKARQAQSRIKMLERMERVELASDAPSVHFSFPASQQSGRTVFEIEKVAKSYDGVKDIFSGCELMIERGDRIAFVGKNGQGKTTLGKILVGEEEITAGTIKPGFNVTIGYYAQHQADSLDPKKSVYATVEELAKSMFYRGGTNSINYSETQLRTLLGAFLFKGDDVHKRVSVLSGGEKSRLALAKMLLEPVNTLILDEPTNHLDMRSKEVLKQAILAFEGTVIVISHDRDFLDDLVDRIIVFENGTVKENYNPLEQYLTDLHNRELEAIKKKPSQKDSDPSKPAETPDEKKNRKRLEAEKRNAKAKNEKPLRDKLKKIEAEMAVSEKRKKEIEDAMAFPEYYEDAAKVKREGLEMNHITSRLESLFADWSEVSEEIESL
jgi:ATP-binding cassette subfamily F protein 3